MSLRRLLLNIAVLLAVIAMVTAGVWQLHRLSERRDRNSTITSRSQLPIAEVQDLAGIDDPLDAGREIEFRLVRAVGVYQTDDQVLIRNRTHQGTAGFWVLTPLLLQAARSLPSIGAGFPTGRAPAHYQRNSRRLVERLR